MYELSLVELESELSAELPARTLMRRRRRVVHVGGTSASKGSVANSNSTSQSINNPQVANAINSEHTRIYQTGDNENENTNTQFGVPVNFFG